jgi:hypothetical protein
LDLAQQHTREILDINNVARDLELRQSLLAMCRDPVRAGIGLREAIAQLDVSLHFFAA